MKQFLFAFLTMVIVAKTHGGELSTSPGIRIVGVESSLVNKQVTLMFASGRSGASISYEGNLPRISSINGRSTSAVVNADGSAVFQGTVFASHNSALETNLLLVLVHEKMNGPVFFRNIIGTCPDVAEDLGYNPNSCNPENRNEFAPILRVKTMRLAELLLRSSSPMVILDYSKDLH